MSDVRELWREIDRWHDEHGAAREISARRAGASSDALAELEARLGRELPADYRESLAIHDGGGYFESYEHLSSRAAGATWAVWHDLSERGTLARRPIADPGALRTWWNDAWIPFAQDSCGNLLCLDTSGRGRILALETQDGQGAYVVAGKRTFTDFLRAYRDKLVSGKLAVDDEGFVTEPLLKPSVTTTAGPAPALEPKLAERVEKLITQGDATALAKLLDAERANADHALKYGRIPLAIAAERGKLAIVELLLARGANPNAGRERGERTALFWAVWGMNTSGAIVDALLRAGADPNAMTRYDGTPLHAAVMWSSAANVATLLRHGGDPHQTNAAGETPLDGAQSPSQQAVKKLLERALRREPIELEVAHASPKRVPTPRKTKPAKKKAETKTKPATTKQRRRKPGAGRSKR